MSDQSSVVVADCRRRMRHQQDVVQMCVCLESDILPHKLCIDTHSLSAAPGPFPRSITVCVPGRRLEPLCMSIYTTPYHIVFINTQKNNHNTLPPQNLPNPKPGNEYVQAKDQRAFCE